MKRRNENAITLVALVITIIVLIILAGVGIYFIMGNNGIFTRAKQAKEETNMQAATEIVNLKITTAKINKYAEKQEMPTLKELSEILKEDSEIEYITATSKVSNVEYNVPSENPTAIYIKLNEYPYEFEINTSLQISTIDGKKVINSSSGNAGEISSGSIGESTVIEEIELIVSCCNGEYLELTCNTKTVNNAEIAGYAFLLNGEVKKYCTENIVNIDGLTLDTNYTVAAVAMDKSGNIKRTNNIEVKTEDKIYLYKEGNECVYLTGGWKYTGYDANKWGTITKNDNNMYIYSPGMSRIYCGTSKTIDLSKYSGLYIEEDELSEGAYRYCTITTKSYFNDTAGSDIKYTSKEKLNILNYNSSYYIHMTVHHNSYISIKNIWLEY